MHLRNIPKCVMSPNSKDAYQDMPFSSLVQRQPLASFNEDILTGFRSLNTAVTLGRASP